MPSRIRYLDQSARRSRGLYNAVLCNQQVVDYRIRLIIIKDSEIGREGGGWGMYGGGFFFLMGKPVGKRPCGRL